MLYKKLVQCLILGMEDKIAITDLNILVFISDNDICLIFIYH